MRRKMLFQIVGTAAAVALVAWIWWPTKKPEAVIVAGDASGLGSNGGAAPSMRCKPGAALMGKSKDEVITECGAPRSISHQIIRNGAHHSEQWTYSNPTFYVYIDNGVAVSIQFAENGENFTWKN